MAKKYIYITPCMILTQIHVAEDVQYPFKAKNNKFFLAFSDQTEKSEVP